MKLTDESSSSLIDTCIACIKICYANATECKEMEGMEDCYNICINCANACEKVVAELKNDTEHLLSAIDKCAHICCECAKECAKHDNDHCRACAKICLKCAEICSRILAHEEISN